MAITRTVITRVNCDVCGALIADWVCNDTGLSRGWAAYLARKRGCTVGERVICKKCRIKKRIGTCSLQRKIGSAGRDGNGMCMGFGNGVSDEPLEACKRCVACTSYQKKE